MTDPNRPRPTPDGSARAGRIGYRTGYRTEYRDAPVTRIEVQPSQVVAAAGTALVTAARVGGLLTRTGWRLARRMPVASGVVTAVEREARRLLSPAEPPPVVRTRTPDEQRAADYVTSVPAGVEPLRGAMAELLERSVAANRTDSRDYLFGTIISQLVPDEARILAALADGSQFAAADVVEKRRRAPDHIVLANASSVGKQAGLVSPESTSTYLTRLHGFGLVEFGPADDSLDVQYDILGAEPAVRSAREDGSRRAGTRQLVRKTVHLSPFGTQFWAASDPAADPALGRPAEIDRPALPPA